ncbi:MULTISPECIES: helix-turn-helix transcriptional regulator [unclassified Streptomyces]|uniref:Helix-turn-helix transcriptional regulator n=1 Tax=Streptomyces salyersiae TaxID=3075530 RepID=A0ABU2RLY9_9ACTN|nr:MULTISPECIES: helix-turn-helix transcriptional regulator [unclassified Streptomyces]MYR66484.1 helix-turn-helix domain-containing protein [Streptomyces sp. SID4939]MYS04545.1 helix-turn-helix domain-containing protein [Streptomyces sp. SID4940]MYT61880.1 helix-turn-helix domain-containing protein [Streptomyces sp. SID8357]MYT85250.1 helix-turn-helix domain-containing protein [Streptomyces sp. SID8360]MYW39055.1 helix-turn-helix domain-containing protein [Streptomyces sp. SID1]
MANEDLGRALRRLRRLASLTQEELAERSGVSVDVIRQLEQGRKHSARLPTLHALANGLGVELTTLLGDPPAVSSSGENDGPRFVAVRRAVMPVLWGPEPEPPGPGFSPVRLREQIAEGWTQYHSAEFDTVTKALPDLISDARAATASADDEDRRAGYAALAKALQLAGHVAVRMGKTDLALISLERATDAAQQSSDPLLLPMIVNSTAWTYQRQGRLEDALGIALRVADDMADAGRTGTADGLKVWGALTMSAATSAARSGDYERAAVMMEAAEKEAGRVAQLPDGGDNRMVSVFSPSSVRIERVRLAVQYGHPQDALALAEGMRLSKDTPPSWRTWLLLDVARAHTDIGDAAGAVKTLESLRRVAPTWMQHHTLAVAVVRDLWALPNHPPGLRALAEFLGIGE